MKMNCALNHESELPPKIERTNWKEVAARTWKKIASQSTKVICFLKNQGKSRLAQIRDVSLPNTTATKYHCISETCPVRISRQTQMSQDPHNRQQAQALEGQGPSRRSCAAQILSTHKAKTRKNSEKRITRDGIEAYIWHAHFLQAHVLKGVGPTRLAGLWCLANLTSESAMGWYSGGDVRARVLRDLVSIRITSNVFW